MKNLCKLTDLNYENILVVDIVHLHTKIWKKHAYTRMFFLQIVKSTTSLHIFSLPIFLVLLHLYWYVLCVWNEIIVSGLTTSIKNSLNHNLTNRFFFAAHSTRFGRRALLKLYCAQTHVLIWKSNIDSFLFYNTIISSFLLAVYWPLAMVKLINRDIPKYLQLRIK